VGHPCPHPVWCVNCSLDHSSNISACSFWKHRYSPKWVHSKYTAQKVGDKPLQFIPATNLPFPNITGGRIPVLYTPPGILLDSSDSPKTEAISPKKEIKSPSSVQARTSSNC
jgi:hypothetical protein